VFVVLWVGVAGGAVGVIWSILQNVAGTNMSASDRWFFLALGVLSAIAAAAAIGATLGLTARDQWGPTAGWITVGAFALTIVLAPLAAAVGWGLVQVPKNQLVSAERRPGGGRRAGSAALVAALALALVGSAAAWGSAHPLTTALTPTPSPSPTGCAIAQAGSPMTATAGGGLCGFQLGLPVVALDCKSASSLPAEIHSLSFNDAKAVSGTGGATFSRDGGGCHFASPSYEIDSRLESVNDLSPGDTVFVADFVSPPTGTLTFGFLFGCDGNGCLQADFSMPDATVETFDGSKSLGSQFRAPRVGTNRLMVMIRQKQITVWFNGTIVTTATVLRSHAAGSYSLYMESFDKTKAVSAVALQFAIYRLA
jgi:hypothetical protein